MTNLYAFMPPDSHYVNLNRIYGPKPRIFNQPQDDALLAMQDALVRFQYAILLSVADWQEVMDSDAFDH